MTLDDIWKDFSDRMCEIELYHRVAKKIVASELSTIAELYEKAKENSDSKTPLKSFHNMAFSDAKSGEVRFYGHRERSIEERYIHVLLHKNKQYQWLLAEAYEEFEDFVEKMYAYLGRLDNNFWPLNDFGSITLSELSNKDFEWYLNQVSKKNKPHTLLSRFRKKFPVIEEIEVTNKLNINMALAIATIERIRHIVVHKGGVVSNKQEFIKGTLESVGLYNNGKPNEKHINYIKSYFGSGKNENLIKLLEINIGKNIPLNIEHDILGWLFQILMAYAHILKDEMVKNEQ